MMAGFGMFGLGMLLVVLFWAVIIVGAIWLLARLVRGNPVGTSASANAVQPHEETPLDVLSARYARGEISKEQFEEMKRDLGLTNEARPRVPAQR